MMRGRRWRKAATRLVPLSGIVALGCASTESRTGDAPVSVAVDTLQGIEWVSSAGEVKPWRLEPVLELGSQGAEGSPADDEFAWVSAVGLGPDGLLYVADLGNDRISVFDTLGELRRVVGRSGQGPGEFQSLYSIAWHGDRLLTLDLGNGRLGAFTSEGEWVGHRPAPGRLVASPVTYRLYQVGPAEVYQWAYRVVDGVNEPTWRRVDGSEGGVEWTRDLPVPEAPFPDKVVCTMGRGFSWFDHPYALRTLGHPYTAERSLRATTNAYEVAVLDTLGDTLRVLSRSLGPATLVDEVWDSTEAVFDEWLSDKDVSKCQPPSLERPAHKPAIEGVMVGSDGLIWVERSLEHGTLWEAFDRTGALVGAMEGLGHDRQRTVPWIGGDFVAWVTREELDFPRVHLARLRRPDPR